MDDLEMIEDAADALEEEDEDENGDEPQRRPGVVGLAAGAGMAAAVGAAMVGDDWFLQAMALKDDQMIHNCYRCDKETKYKCMNQLPVKCKRYFCINHMAKEERFMINGVPACCLECSLVRYEISQKAEKSMWTKRVLAVFLFFICFLIPFIVISVPGVVVSE